MIKHYKRLSHSYKHKKSGKVFLNLDFLASYMGIAKDKIKECDYIIIENNKKNKKEQIYINEHKLDFL